MACAASPLTQHPGSPSASPAPGALNKRVRRFLLSLLRRRRGASLLYPRETYQQLLDIGANPPKAGLTMRQAAARYVTNTDGVFTHTRIELTPAGKRAVSCRGASLLCPLLLLGCVSAAPVPSPAPVRDTSPIYQPPALTRQYIVKNLFALLLALAILCLSGCDFSPAPVSPSPVSGYAPAALRSSSNDAAECIDLIESGRVPLSGTQEDRDHLMNRLYAIVKR